MHLNFIQSIMKNNIDKKISSTSLRLGQIVNGEILKLFKSNMALLQIGSLKMHAELDAPLQEQSKYLFQITSIGPPVKLKMLEQAKEMKIDKSATVDQLLRLFSLPNKTINKTIIKFFLENELPLSHELLTKASKWVQSSENLAVDLKGIKQLIVKEFPYTEETFKALRSLYDETPISTNIKNLFIHLPENTLKKELRHLLTKNAEIESMLNQLLLGETVENDTFKVREQFANMLKQMFKGLGLQYEYDVAEKAQSITEFSELDTLKPLLIEIGKTTSDIHVKKAADSLVDKLTCLQLHSSVNSPIQQYIHQIPVQFGGEFKDLTIQWSGRKTSLQKLDPNYCRIIFYLDLEELKETFIDVQIQNRIINITVTNDTVGLKEMIEKLQLCLKDYLAQLNYTLSSIKVQQTATQIENRKNKLIDQSPYLGVDIRI